MNVRGPDKKLYSVATSYTYYELKNGISSSVYKSEAPWSCIDYFSLGLPFPYDFKEVEFDEIIGCQSTLEFHIIPCA